MDFTILWQYCERLFFSKLFKWNIGFIKVIISMFLFKLITYKLGSILLGDCILSRKALLLLAAKAHRLPTLLALNHLYWSGFYFFLNLNYLII